MAETDSSHPVFSRCYNERFTCTALRNLIKFLYSWAFSSIEARYMDDTNSSRTETLFFVDLKQISSKPISLQKKLNAIFMTIIMSMCKDVFVKNLVEFSISENI